MGFKRMFHVVDVHSGEPARVITGGVSTIPGDTVYEQLKWLEENDDQIRRLLIKEPRAYPPVCCNLIVPAKNPKASAGYIIMEQDEYPLISGSNTISVGTVLLETGMVPMAEPVTDFYLDGAAGLIHVKAECRNGRVKNITFKNVPSFAAYTDAVIAVPTIGNVTVDVAWGGVWFVIADVSQFENLKLESGYGAEITRVSSLLLEAARQQLPVHHPEYPDEKIMIPLLSGKTDNPDADLKNAVSNTNGMFDINNPSTWKGALDRSPCGTGTSAKMAALHAKGRLKLHDKFRHENFLGLIYTGEIVEETMVGEYRAIVPEISGRAWITGFTTVVLEEDDPFPDGFTVGDIWQ